MKPLSLATLACIALAAIEIHAESPVFKSVDPDGRVTYGDQPTDQAIDFDVIEIKPTIANIDTGLDKRLERMAATTKRLQADRKARESERVKEQPKNTVVYYPAASQGGNSGRYYSGNRRDKHRAVNRYYSGDHNGSHSTKSFHRDRNSFNLGLGFRSSHFDGSLQLGNRHLGNRHSRHEHNNHSGRSRQQHSTYAPLKEYRHSRAAPSPYPSSRHTPRNQR